MRPRSNVEGGDAPAESGYEEDGMSIWHRRLARLACGGLVVVGLPALAAGQAFVYPERGQSPQQQQQDRGQCYSWAAQQSGFDPATARVNAPPPPPPNQQVVGSGAMAGGAMRGAAVGAVGGAIAGDAGKGAAIGAGAGALLGGMRRRQEIDQQNAAYQNQVAQQHGAVAQGQANYDRAFAACMAGRGYTVR
jgi:predicted lipid-binding transport protein (Tim44 family)